MYKIKILGTNDKSLQEERIVEIEKPESAHVNHSWVRILALIPCLVAAANLLYVQLELSIHLSISLSIQL